MYENVEIHVQKNLNVKNVKGYVKKVNTYVKTTK